MRLEKPGRPRARRAMGGPFGCRVLGARPEKTQPLAPNSATAVSHPLGTNLQISNSIKGGSARGSLPTARASTLPKRDRELGRGWFEACQGKVVVADWPDGLHENGLHGTMGTPTSVGTI